MVYVLFEAILSKNMDIVWKKHIFEEFTKHSSSSLYMYSYRVSRKGNSLKGEIKDGHNTLFISKVISVKGCLNIDHRDMNKQLTQYNWSYVCLTKDV